MNDQDTHLLNLLFRAIFRAYVTYGGGRNRSECIPIFTRTEEASALLHALDERYLRGQLIDARNISPALLEKLDERYHPQRPHPAPWYSPEVVHGWFSRYIGEFGADCDDEQGRSATFVDFVVCQLHQPGGSEALALWYENRARQVRRQGRNDARRHDEPDGAA